MSCLFLRQQALPCFIRNTSINNSSTIFDGLPSLAQGRLPGWCHVINVCRCSNHGVGSRTDCPGSHTILQTAVGPPAEKTPPEVLFVLWTIPFTGSKEEDLPYFCRLTWQQRYTRYRRSPVSLYFIFALLSYMLSESFSFRQLLEILYYILRKIAIIF